MEAQVVFDKKGKVVAMLHLPSKFSFEQTAGRAPMAVLEAQSGQQVATLRIPPEMEHFNPAQLHASVQVDVSGDSARLVARKERKR